MQTIAIAKASFSMPTRGGTVTIKAGETFCGALTRYSVFYFWVEAPNKMLYKVGLPDDGSLLHLANDAYTTKEQASRLGG